MAAAYANIISDVLDVNILRIVFLDEFFCHSNVVILLPAVQFV